MSSGRFDFRAAVPPATDLGRVHLIAIGGAGMSAVARLLLSAGVPVSGSDAQDSPGLADLRAAGAQVWVGHDARHVAGIDTVIVSSAIREDNVELVQARRDGARILHRSQGLAALTPARRVVAVAGANGKTTTTSMLVVALNEAGAAPSFASGALIPQLGTNAALAEGADFVVEADESDGSFVVYRPEVAVVTNVQPDHLDHYGDFAGVQAAYRAFIDTIPRGGLLIACADDAGARDLAQHARTRSLRVSTYGRHESADVRIEEAEASDHGSRARLAVDGQTYDLELAVPGAHNVENAAGAFAALTLGCAMAPESALAGLGSFTGAARRFESHGEPGGVRIIDDYAHNAPKVAAAVRTGADLAGRRGGRLIVLFQPHLYSRTRDFADGFAAGLEPADEVVLLEIYGAREDPIEGVSSDLIAGPLRAAPGERVVRRAATFAAAEQAVLSTVRAGDVVMTIGAGDVTTVAPRLASALAAGGSPAAAAQPATAAAPTTTAAPTAGQHRQPMMGEGLR
ncbi:MAG: UDP-N-acetylmuramate--L-alanine ligase [Actinomycetia bacterium]|nr:UDP-N-acetylmuramate--L-alanine ligase [Actinomycetes bacterium]